MSLAMLLTGLAAMTGAAGPVHAVPVEHHGRAVEARYRGDVRIAYRQVGMPTLPGKMGTARCIWTAHVKVERHVAGPDGSHVLHPSTVGDPMRLTGGRPGDCRTAKPSIAAEVARRDGEIRDLVRMAAEADAPTLRRDLDGARRYARR